MDLKQSAAANIMLLMVDATDHVTGKVGLTLTVTASKNGSAFSALDAGAVISEVANGWYKIALTSADTDIIGDLVVHATGTGADPADRLVSVVAATPTDNATSLSALTGYVDTEVAAIKAKTDLIPADPAAASTAMTLTSAYDSAKTAATQASVNAISGYVDTEIAAIKAKTDLIPAQPAAVGSAMTLTSAYDSAKTSATQASVDALLTTAMTESYAADGATATPAQALCMILQLLAEKTIAGTTMTVKKLDGVTTAMTFSLNSATAPTSITRTA